MEELSGGSSDLSCNVMYLVITKEPRVLWTGVLDDSDSCVRVIRELLLL